MIFTKRLFQSIGTVVAGSALFGSVQAYYTQSWSGVVMLGKRISSPYQPGVVS